MSAMGHLPGTDVLMHGFSFKTFASMLRCSDVPVLRCSDAQDYRANVATMVGLHGLMLLADLEGNVRCEHSFLQHDVPMYVRLGWILPSESVWGWQAR